MRFIACGDIHISDNLPYSSHTHDRLGHELKTAMGTILEACKKNDIRYLVVAGDTFDRIDVSPREIRFFAEMTGWLETYDIHLITISGNHEMDESGDSAVKAIGIMDHRVNTAARDGRWYSIPFENVEMCLFDYHSSHAELRKNIRTAIRKSDEDRRIFIGHQPVENAIMSTQALCAHGVPEEWFHENGVIGKHFKMWIMGDFHRWQPLPGNGFYTGSVIQQSFKDEGSCPSYHIIDTDTMSATPVPIKTPLFHTVRIIEGKQEGPDYSKLTSNGYIRLLIAGTQAFVDNINVDQIKEKIVEEFSPWKLMLVPPTIVTSPVEVEDMFVSRQMSNEELVQKIIAKHETELPEQILYEAGVKYLREAKEQS